MSTNKTPNYDLHSWEPTDDFLLTEINENFTALDAALRGRAKLVVGSYVGDKTADREIVVGAPILALFLENTNGQRHCLQTSLTVGGLVLPGLPLRGNACYIEGDSFFVSTQSESDSRQTNRADFTYIYLAWVGDN